MSRSDLERLAESMRALAGQVERDVPLLQERRHHITQIAARAMRLAGPGNPSLADVAQHARLAADRLADAIDHLITTARSGHDYATGVAGRTGGGSTVPAADIDQSAPASNDEGSVVDPGTATHDQVSERRRSKAHRREELRRALLDKGEDVSNVLAEISQPVLGPPPEVRIDGVDDPVSAVVVVATLVWEGGVRWLKRQRRPPA